ncbi:MAG: putative motility protein, partial [Clostridiales bacterium]|nr:putative motility protein [Clostridiales bacterium]
MELGIARLSTAMSSMKIGTEFSMKVMKMAMDQMEDVG